jgi:hypothetical protein
VPSPQLSTIRFEQDLAGLLPQLPPRRGVVQLLGGQGESLLIGQAANLRLWVKQKLGGGRPRPGRRPPIDLSPVARAVRFITTTTGFHQRLCYERLMGEHVPLSARRDLKTPAYLRLDLDVRFPRLTVTAAPASAPPGFFGPFRDHAAAVRARDALSRHAGLRPCDYVFEPDPALPLGLGCVHAQVRTCAAPCLLRLGEAEYGARAAEVGRWLLDPDLRPDGLQAWLSSFVADAAGNGVVVEAARTGLELFPVRSGAVLEERATQVDPADLEGALEGLSWEPCLDSRDDRRWLSAWLHGPRRRGWLVPVAEAPPSRLAARVHRLLQADGGGSAVPPRWCTLGPQAGDP